MHDRFEVYRGRPTPEDVAKGAFPYYAAERLSTAVNTALAVSQPLLVTGEAGTGKSTLARSIAAELDRGPVLEFHTRSDSVGRDVLYQYDHLRRFYDAQVQDERARRIQAYRHYGAIGQAILSDRPRVVLIDEIDKAPPDFANDLLNVIDRWELDFPDTDEQSVVASAPPLVIITSNRESRLSQAFLRRTVYHHIDFPDEAQLRRILTLHAHADARGSGAPPADFDELAEAALGRFIELRERFGDDWEKKPTTGELLVWVRALRAAGYVPEQLADGFSFGRHPLIGTLVKTATDLARVTAAG